MVNFKPALGSVLSSVLVLTMLHASSHALAADDLTLAVSIGATHTDNVDRTSVNPESETTGELGLVLGWDKERGRLTADVNADLQYRSYLDDSYDDELLGGLQGTVTYWFNPDRFSWVVQENFGQTLIEPRSVDTPDNRQNTNYFSTGPDLIIPLGGRTDLSLQGRWSSVSYEDNDDDSQRLSGVLGLIRRLGPTSEVSVNGIAERVEYDNSPPNSDFDRQSAYFGFEAEGVRTSLSLRAGYTAVHDFEDTIDGPLFTLAVARQMSSRSTLTLDAGTNLTDAADAFRQDQFVRGVEQDSEDVVVTQDSYQSDYASVSWDLQGERSAGVLSLDWRREDHERDEALNREAIGAGVTFSRRLGQRLTANLQGRWTREKFDESNVDFDEWSAGFGLDYSLGANWTVTLRGDVFEGSGDTIDGTGAGDYEENRVTFRVSYQPGT